MNCAEVGRCDVQIFGRWHMKCIIQFLLLLGLMTSSHGREILIPSGYLANRSVDERCSLLKLPREIVNTEICIYDSSLEQVAFQSGLFENEQGRWVLSGPGVPNFPTIKKEKKPFQCMGLLYAPLKMVPVFMAQEVSVFMESLLSMIGV